MNANNSEYTASHLQPEVLGKFNTVEEWEDKHQSIVGSHKNVIFANDAGEVCLTIEDVKRSEEEDKLPIFYFKNLIERILADVQEPVVNIVGHSYIYDDEINVKGKLEKFPRSGVVLGSRPSHHNGHQIRDVEALYSKSDADKAIQTVRADLDEAHKAFRYLSMSSVNYFNTTEAKLKFANERIENLEKELAEHKKA